MGKRRDGVHSLSDMQARCIVDEDTGCWIWQGGVQFSQGHERPVVWVTATNRTESARRRAWVLAGKPLQPGQMVFGTCGRPLCICPAHSAAGSMKDLGTVRAEAGFDRGPKRSAATRRSWEWRGALTAELAAWARESQQTQREAAHALGCTPATVSKVRLGRIRAPLLPNASVFTMRA